MAQTHLQRRNGCFYYRQKIPADLLVHYGQSEIVRSLRTSKQREASAAGYEQGHTWAREFAKVRAGGLQTVPRAVAEAQGLLEALDALPIEQAAERPQPKQAKVLLRNIDDEFVTRTCATYLNEIDGADAEVRANRGNHGEIHRLWSDLTGGPTLKDLESMLSVGPIGQAVHELLAAFLSDNNYVAGRAVPGYSKLCVRFLDSLIRARKIVEDRNAGRPPATEGIAPLAMTFKGQQVEHGLTIAGLHALWAAKQTATPKTTDEFLSIIRSFEAFVIGQFRTDQAAAVKQVYVVAYRNELTASGLKPKTVTKKISTIKTLFTSAIDDGLLGPSEVQDVKVGQKKKRKKGAKSRLPFELDELIKIFSAEIYSKTPGKIKGSEAEYWAPLISLFSGMRIEEICQLRVSDVREHKGQPFFSVIDGDEQELKTETSRRNVPVHAELKDCGFLEFVRAARAAKNEWLFPELQRDKYGRRSSAFGKRWNRKLRKVISLKDSDHTKMFHSFRHLFKHTARQCRIDEDVHDALSGHGSKDSEARKYGGLSYPEDPLFEGMKEFEISGLDLSHLYLRSWPNQGKEIIGRI
jgi:integrase